MSDAISLTVARLRAARERLARGRRCAALGLEVTVLGNNGGPDLTKAAADEMIAATRDLLLARSHLATELVLQANLSRSLKRALMREARADMQAAIGMLDAP